MDDNGDLTFELFDKRVKLVSDKILGEAVRCHNAERSQGNDLATIVLLASLTIVLAKFVAQRFTEDDLINRPNDVLGPVFETIAGTLAVLRPSRHDDVPPTTTLQ